MKIGPKQIKMILGIVHFQCFPLLRLRVETYWDRWCGTSINRGQSVSRIVLADTNKVWWKIKSNQIQTHLNSSIKILKGWKHAAQQLHRDELVDWATWGLLQTPVSPSTPRAPSFVFTEFSFFFFSRFWFFFVPSVMPLCFVYFDPSLNVINRIFWLKNIIRCIQNAIKPLLYTFKNEYETSRQIINLNRSRVQTNTEPSCLEIIKSLNRSDFNYIQ